MSRTLASQPVLKVEYAFSDSHKLRYVRRLSPQDGQVSPDTHLGDAKKVAVARQAFMECLISNGQVRGVFLQWSLRIGLLHQVFATADAYDAFARSLGRHTRYDLKGMNRPPLSLEQIELLDVAVAELEMLEREFDALATHGGPVVKILAQEMFAILRSFGLKDTAAAFLALDVIEAFVLASFCYAEGDNPTKAGLAIAMEEPRGPHIIFGQEPGESRAVLLKRIEAWVDDEQLRLSRRSPRRKSGPYKRAPRNGGRELKGYVRWFYERHALKQTIGDIARRRHRDVHPKAHDHGRCDACRADVKHGIKNVNSLLGAI